MKAIILSAGYATRLYPLTENQPKGLLPLNNVPIINYMLEHLEKIDEIDEAIVITNNKFYSHFNAWKDTYNGRLSLKVINDGTTNNDNRLGAIGDMQFVIEKENLDSDIMILASDNYFTFDLKDFYDYYKEKQTNCILAEVFKDEDLEYLGKGFAVATFDKDHILTSIVEKPGGIPSSNIGLWATAIYTKDTLAYIKKYLDEGNNKDSPNNFPAWLHKILPIHAYVVESPCYDIGTIEIYEALNKELSDK